MNLISEVDSLEFSLQSEDGITFDLANDEVTMVLSNDEPLQFSLAQEEGMIFDLGAVGSIGLDLVTPTVVDAVMYDGDYEVTPKTYQQTLDTRYKMLNDDVTIKEIPYFETSNDSDGLTVYIANTLA